MSELVPESEQQYGSILTIAGEAAEQNSKLLKMGVEITHIAFGDANDAYVQPNRSQTSLINEIDRIPVNAVDVQQATPDAVPMLRVEAILPPEKYDLVIREFASVASFNGQELYHAVGNCARIYVPPPANNGNMPTPVTLEMFYVITSGEAIVEIDPRVVHASREFVYGQVDEADDRLSKTIIDQNGKDWFIEDGFLVTPSGGVYEVNPGVGYVSGYRVVNEPPRLLDVHNKPSFVYVDASREAVINNAVETQFNLIADANELDDYIDANGVKHFVCKIAQVMADGSVADLRPKQGRVLPWEPGKIAYANELRRFVTANGLSVDFYAIGPALMRTEPGVDFSQYQDITVRNVAMLHALDYPLGTIIRALGYYEPGDCPVTLRYVVTNDIPDGFGDQPMSNGLCASLEVGDKTDVRTFGARDSDIGPEAVDCADSIIACLVHPKTKTIVLPDIGQVQYDDKIPERGFYGTKKLVVPINKNTEMLSPYVYGGKTFPAIQYGVPAANFATKPHFKKLHFNCVKYPFTSWDDTQEIGVRIHCMDFCEVRWDNVLGFYQSIQFACDDSSFAYNDVYWGQMRGGKILATIEVTNRGYFNECRHYGGRFSTNPVPVGKEAEDRYGLITSTDHEPIENHIWYQPTFELGGRDDPNEESVCFVADKCWGWKIINARTEQHKKYVMRCLGDSRDVDFESSYGKVGGGVPTYFSGRSADVLDDQSIRKTNRVRIRWERAFDSMPVNVNVDLSGVYPDGNSGAVRGAFFVPSSDFIGNRQRLKALVNVRPAGNGVLVPAGSHRLGVSFDVRGTKLLMLNINQNQSDQPVYVRCYDKHGADLYDANKLLVINNVYGNEGGSTSSLWGGSYNVGPPMDGQVPLTVDDAVGFIDVLVGGLPTYEIYGLSVSGGENVSQVKVYTDRTAISKPTWADSLADGMVVGNTAFTGEGVNSWRLNQGVWYDIGSQI